MTINLDNNSRDVLPQCTIYKRYRLDIEIKTPIRRTAVDKLYNYQYRQ